MHDSSLLTILVFVISGLIGLNALSYYSRRLMLLPDVIWVLCLGMIYGGVSHFELIKLPELHLEPTLVFFILVPILIFAATRKMCLHIFRSVLKAATLLATVGIVISMLFVASILYFVFQIPLLESLLFGVIVSATDPIAVSAILEEAKGISLERKMLIEGESILNDGFVVAVFATLSVMIFGQEEISLALSGGKLVANIAGALAIGVILGRAARFLLAFWRLDAWSFTVNITLALAFSSFFLAELFHLPGILAVFSGALAFGYRPDMSSGGVGDRHDTIWEYLEYIVNSILFFLLGASFFSQATLGIITITFVGVGVGILFMARIIALGTLWPLLKIEGARISLNDFWLLNFSGSRGAISIALILQLPNSFHYKPMFLTMTFIMVIFSLVAYPLFLKKVLHPKAD